MRLIFIALVLFAVGPIYMVMTKNVAGKSWQTARRDSAGIAPPASTTERAVVQVYAARAYGWRGAIGVHTWIAAKPTGAQSYTLYQVLGWRHYRGHPALSISQGTPDRYWFGSRPQLLAALEGQGVDAVIAKIDHAARQYPYQSKYRLWPGPNSNTFTAWIGRQVPELRLSLPNTAIGKDWLGATGLVAAAPSGTGFQFSLLGVAGILGAWDEGLEINIAGLSLGFDVRRPALKIPGIGRIGWPRATPIRLLETQFQITE